MIEDVKKLWLDSRRCENTRNAYEGAVNAFIAAGYDLATAQRKDVTEYIISMTDNGSSPSTTNLHLAALSSFYRFAIRQEVLEKNPADIERLKVNPYGKSDYLDKDQARAILGQIDRKKISGRRDYALLFGYLMTGLRNTAWRTARWEDFSHKNGKRYYRWSLKTHTNEDTMIAPPLWDALMDLSLCTKRTHGYVFTALNERANRFDHVNNFMMGKTPLSMGYVNDLLKKYAVKAGLKPEEMHIHLLRHTYAMMRVEAGDDMLTVSKLLNHNNMAVTQIYVDHLRQVEDQHWKTVGQWLGAN